MIFLSPVEPKRRSGKTWSRGWAGVWANLFLSLSSFSSFSFFFFPSIHLSVFRSFFPSFYFSLHGSSDEDEEREKERERERETFTCRTDCLTKLTSFPHLKLRLLHLILGRPTPFMAGDLKHLPVRQVHLSGRYRGFDFFFRLFFRRVDGVFFLSFLFFSLFRLYLSFFPSCCAGREGGQSTGVWEKKNGERESNCFFILEFTQLVIICSKDTHHLNVILESSFESSTWFFECRCFFFCLLFKYL